MEKPTLSVTRVTGFTGRRQPCTFNHFVQELGAASRTGHQAYTWAGETPDGVRLVIIWVIGRRSGAVTNAYELSGGEDE